MKLICCYPRYRFKTSFFSFLVHWNYIYNLETNEIYYEAIGIINKLLAKLIFKRTIIYEKEIIK